MRAGDINVALLNLTVDVHLTTITKVINLSLRNGCFLNDLKSIKVSLVFKKDNGLEKGNCRPVSALCLTCQRSLRERESKVYSDQQIVSVTDRLLGKT